MATTGAAYDYSDIVRTDQTFSFTIEWVQDDGSSFPWADYTIALTVSRDGSTAFSLAQVGSPGVAGIYIDKPNDRVTFQGADGCFTEPGVYDVACRITHVTTGQKLIPFAGPLTVVQGLFS